MFAVAELAAVVELSAVLKQGTQADAAAGRRTKSAASESRERGSSGLRTRRSGRAHVWQLSSASSTVSKREQGTRCGRASVNSPRRRFAPLLTFIPSERKDGTALPCTCSEWSGYGGGQGGTSSAQGAHVVVVVVVVACPPLGLRRPRRPGQVAIRVSRAFLCHVVPFPPWLTTPRPTRSLEVCGPRS